MPDTNWCTFCDRAVNPLSVRPFQNELNLAILTLTYVFLHNNRILYIAQKNATDEMH